MRNEAEIREKVEYYERMLAGVEVGKEIDNPDTFLLLSQHLPREAMQMLHTSTETEALVRNLPVEDQPWVRQWFGSLSGFARQVLETRVNILKWVLEQDTHGGG